MTLNELLDQFVANNRKIQSEKTVSVYRTAIRQLAAAIQRDPTIDDLTDSSLIQLERHLKAANRSVYTVNERVGRIKALWRWACKQGMKGKWPTVDKLPEPEPIKPTHTIEQLRQLLDHIESLTGKICEVSASSYWRAFHLICWDTAERSGTILQLEWIYIQEDGSLEIPASCTKDRKNHYFPLSTETLAALADIKAPKRELIFPWSSGCFWTHYRALIEGAGLPYIKYKSGPHKIRRTVANIVRNEGGDASEMLNHTNSAVTRKFYLAALSREKHPNQKLPRLGRKDKRA